MLSSHVSSLIPRLSTALSPFLPASFPTNSSSLLFQKILIQHNQFTLYIGFLLGIVAFVLSLAKFTLRYQFHQLGWTFLTILLVVLQSCAHLSNVYSGLVWFLLSTTLVITNDVFAYIVGLSIGRTPLIALSPKKTWEGFLGGAFFTVLWSLIAVNVMRDYDFFMCPQTELYSKPFEALYSLTCGPEVKLAFSEPVKVFSWIGLDFQTPALNVHAFVLAMFASLVAPFGGFFASGTILGFRTVFKCGKLKVL